MAAITSSVKCNKSCTYELEKLRIKDSSAVVIFLASGGWVIFGAASKNKERALRNGDTGEESMMAPESHDGKPRGANIQANMVADQMPPNYVCFHSFAFYARTVDLSI